ncbi:unnamed protein product [Lymnaea stagnalis]|uniref:Uncharacterized protein n=1 Tax=Lymnaea stagnalis TaxID=6523 RepID=A0AAV2HJ29_LYMST
MGEIGVVVNVCGFVDIFKAGISQQATVQRKEMADPFLGFELLLFRRFQQQPALWYEWRERLRRRADPDTSEDLEAACANDDSTLMTLESLEELGFGDIQQDLWFLSVMLHRRPKHLLEFVQEEIERERCKRFPKYGESLMMRYLNLHNFTVLSLDSMFKFGDDNRLPREIFRCQNVKYLSLKYNSLEYLPCDIGRLANLEYLALTNNKLSVWSLPYSLTFLTRLHTLYLDNNLLDALPGFLPFLPALETVHRHGNHNYFKSTFMWYHTDVNLRIIPVACEAQAYCKHESLQFWAAKAIIGSKLNFFQDPNIVPVLKDYISDIYRLFHICHHCNKACLSNTNGFKVITFKNPYLGNTCVPFQHWACSRECARAVEIPARLEQISAARELDLRYENYIKECIRKFSTCRSPRNMLSCAMSPDHGSCCGKGGDSPSKWSNTLNIPRKQRNRKRNKRLGPSVKSKCGCLIS